MILQTYPTTFQVVFFLKGNVVKNLSDFISPDNLRSFGESMHWARTDQKLSLEETAKKAGCSIEDIDALETGRGEFNLPLTCRLLELYQEKLFINVESYND